MYGKIYEQTFTGSLVGSGPLSFAIWAYVIAHQTPEHALDRDCEMYVELNPMLITGIMGGGTTKQDVDAVIQTFTEPDSLSRSREYEGRRLKHICGMQYLVLNGRKFRGMRNERERAEYKREWDRENRSRSKSDNAVGLPSEAVGRKSESDRIRPRFRGSEDKSVPRQEIADQDSAGALFVLDPDPDSPKSSPKKKPFPHQSPEFAAAWQDWEDYRKEKKAKLTPTTVRAQHAKLAALTEPEAIAMIRQSIEMGWTGLFPPGSPRSGAGDPKAPRGSIAANSPPPRYPIPAGTTVEAKCSPENQAKTRARSRYIFGTEDNYTDDATRHERMKLPPEEIDRRIALAAADRTS